MNYSCTSKYFLRNQIGKTTTKIIIKMLMILDFKIKYFHCDLYSSIDDLIPLHMKIIDF